MILWGLNPDPLVSYNDTFTNYNYKCRQHMIIFFSSSDSFLWFFVKITFLLLPSQVLCIQGFLTCRKHAERIILLVEMLQVGFALFVILFFAIIILTLQSNSQYWIQDSGFPCFRGGPRAIQNLRKRFHLSLTEEVFLISLLFLLYFVISISSCMLKMIF